MDEATTKPTLCLTAAGRILLAAFWIIQDKFHILTHWIVEINNPEMILSQSPLTSFNRAHHCVIRRVVTQFASVNVVSYFGGHGTLISQIWPYHRKRGSYDFLAHSFSIPWSGVNERNAGLQGSYNCRHAQSQIHAGLPSVFRPILRRQQVKSRNA